MPATYKKRMVRETTALLLCLGLGATALAQPARSVTVTAEDAAGAKRNMIIGVDPRATYGFDPILHELPLPPVPPGMIFDARLIDPNGRKQYKYEGSARDIRQFTSPKQVDTFFVAIQSTHWPVTLGWDESVRSWCDSVVVRGRSTPLQANIARQGKALLPTEKYKSVMIVLYGPKIQ